MQFDASGPFLSAAIVTRDGDRFPLWLDAASGSPGHRDRPFLSELTVKLNLGGVPIITAQLTPPYEEGVELLNSFVTQWANDSMLTAQLGYKGGTTRVELSPVYEGLLLKPDIQIGTDVSVTLNAQGLPRFNYSTTGGTRALRGSRAAIVQQLLRGPSERHPSTMELDTSEVEALGHASPQYQLLFDRPLNFAQSGRTDWQLIGQLLWESRCYYTVSATKLRVIPTLIAASRRPQRTFATFAFARGRLGGGSRVYPIISVSSPSYGVYLMTRSALGMQQQDIDPRTGAARQGVVNDATVQPARTSSGTLAHAPSQANPGASRNGQQGPAFMPGDPADQRATAQAHAAFEEFQTRDGVKLEIETVGIPDLSPGELIAVVGLGWRLDVNYIIFDVTHTAGSGGYTTKLTCVANVNTVLERAQTELGLANLGPLPQPPAGHASATSGGTVELTATPAGGRGRPGASALGGGA